MPVRIQNTISFHCALHNTIRGHVDSIICLEVELSSKLAWTSTSHITPKSAKAKTQFSYSWNRIYLSGTQKWGIMPTTIQIQILAVEVKGQRDLKLLATWPCTPIYSSVCFSPFKVAVDIIGFNPLPIKLLLCFITFHFSFAFHFTCNMYDP